MSRSVDWSRLILAPPKRHVRPAKAARQSTRDADDGRAAFTPLGSYEPSASQQPRDFTVVSKRGYLKLVAAARGCSTRELALRLSL